MPRKSGPHRREKLSAISLRGLPPGLYQDGGNLAFRKRSPTSASWLFRYMLAGKTHIAGLGPWPDVSLKRARELARDLRASTGEGRNPLAQRARGAAMTLSACAESFIAAKAPGWSVGQTRQWQASLRDHVFPKLGDVSVAAIDVPAVRGVLSPIWLTVPTTARRVRQRIENILDWASAHSYRTGDNPAAKLILNLLPKQSHNVAHFQSLAVAELPAFMRDLRRVDSVVARALEFTILTAVRTSTARGATWSEIDLAARTWTIPPARMKSNREHVVPVVDRGMAILEARVGEPDLVFGVMTEKAMLKTFRSMGYDATVHGMRSSFRDWAAEAGFARDVAEAALGHAVAGSASEAAYLRTTLFQRRAKMMAAWAAVCAGEVATSDGVIALRA